MDRMYRFEGPFCTHNGLTAFVHHKKYLNRGDLSRKVKWNTAAALRSLYFLEVPASFPKIAGPWPGGCHPVARLPVSTVTLCGKTGNNNQKPWLKMIVSRNHGVSLAR